LIVLTGDGQSIYYNAAHTPLRDWTNYHVRLDETDAWLRSMDGQPATMSDIQYVLTHLDELSIRAYYPRRNSWTGIRTSGLDNVYLGKEFAAPPALPVASRFEEGDEGWTSAGGPFERTGSITHQSLGGCPDGHITAEGTGTRYWIAPSAFRGDLSAVYGWTLAFDLNTSAQSNRGSVSRIMVLEGGGLSLYIDGDYTERSDWTSFAFRLDEMAPWKRTETGNRASQSDIKSVLSALGQLKIRGYNTNINRPSYSRICGLDNVVLTNHFDEPVGPQIVSTFNTGTEGWTSAGGPFERTGTTDYSSDGGNPGGCVSVTGKGTRYWIAPARFRGDLSAAYGKELSFDLITSKRSNRSNVAALIILEGNGVSLYYDGTPTVQTEWTHYSVRLDATEHWFKSGGSVRATETEIRAVLSAMGQLKIRGYNPNINTVSGSRKGGLDNVMLRLE
jgi:hypothetical protein